jgi:hypothetical protein
VGLAGPLVRRSGTLGIASLAADSTTFSRSTRLMPSRLQLRGGHFFYLLGLVVIASCPGQFWLGFLLAPIPILRAAIARVISWREPRG